MEIKESLTTNAANAHIAGGGLFTVSDKTLQINVFGKSLELKYPVALPTSPIDIHKKFPWSNNSNDKEEVPCVYAEEYELTWGQTVTNLQRIIESFNQIKSGVYDPYLTMYTAKKTGFKYSFPHLLGNGSNLRNIGNSWSSKEEFDLFKSLGKLGSKGKNVGSIFEAGSNIKAIGEDAISGILPGFGFEEAQKYCGTEPKQLTVSFPLYNTKDTKTAFRNYCFCLLFAFQNLKTRTSFMTYIPPKIYNLSNPYNGGVYMPVAVVDSFDVESIGTSRVLKDYKNDGLTNSEILIPEAYKVTIVFRELLAQSTNIMLGSMGGNKVSVINNDAIEVLANAGTNILNTALDFGVKSINTIANITLND